MIQAKQNVFLALWVKHRIGKNEVAICADYSTGTGCWACPEGTYAPEEGSNLCSLCPPGYHNNQTGQPLCSACALGYSSMQLVVHFYNCRFIWSY